MINSVYIHIPFCTDICSYCDFCKLYYNSDLADKYLEQLEQEIKFKYKNDLIKTIYIGGGTPSSLNVKQLTKLFKIIKLFRVDYLEEFTFECNIESITEEKLKILKNNGVNRISVGIQTLNTEYIIFLNRHHNKKMVYNQIELIKSILKILI